MRISTYLIAALLVLSACTADRSPEASASRTPGSAMPSLPPLPGTVGEDGTVLWAELASGVYATTHFQPPLSLAVEEGWYGVDADYVLNLTRDNGSFSLLSMYRYGGQVTVDRCTGAGVVEQREGLDALLEWVKSYAGLEVTEQQPTTVGGYEARVLDIDFAGGQVCPGDKVVNGVSHSVAVLWAGEVGEILGVDERIRAVFVEHPDGPLIITLRTLPVVFVPPELQEKFVELEDFIDLAQPVLESIEFDPVAD